MRHWKPRLIAFLTCFVVGMVLFVAGRFIFSFLRPHNKIATRLQPSAQNPCGTGESFSSPEEIVAALKSEDVLVRREIFRRLFLRPNVATIYYDYERDRDYPERAERAELKYLNLDDERGDEAVLTFLRYENPVALILKKEKCGWRLASALSAWLRLEDYPYHDWLELPETVKPGVHEILVRRSIGDGTSYMRSAHLLKLMDGALTEVAEFTEESIKPVEDYREADWGNVKLHEATRYSFLQGSDGKGAQLRLETQEEIIKYSGTPSSNTFWLETDGAWHTSMKQWRQRPASRVRLLNKRMREFTWDEQRKRFVEEK